MGVSARGIWTSAILSVNMAAAAGGYDVAAYFFPGFHVDPRNEAYLFSGYTEWSNIKAAKPGYDGHFQPRVPLWGYQDEALPAEMAKKIDAAADHGVTAFIFDWYWYGGKPFLERALNEGYLKAANRDRVKFYLMWANHDWLDIFPLGRPGSGGKIFDGAADRRAFDAAVDHVIKDYFSQPSYFKIAGAPVFSIYELGTLINGLVGLEPTRQALESFRAKVKAAGFPDLHLNGILWGNIPSSLSGVPGDRTPTQGKTVSELGLASLTTYTWTHYVNPNGDYIPWAEQGVAAWSRYDADFPATYFPHVTIGWDTNPRRVNHDANHVTGNTPNRFAEYLWRARSHLDRNPMKPKLITLNSWNEWPEGSYLEPDTLYGMDYLEAVKDVMLRGWNNVASAGQGGKVSASSVYSADYPASAAIDGDRGGARWQKGGGWNDATAEGFPDWIQVDFDGPKRIGRIEVYTLHSAFSGLPGVPTAKPMGVSSGAAFERAGLTDFSVQYWDGQQWKAVPGGTVSGNRKVRRRFEFEPLVTGRIRVFVTGAMDGYSRVVELEAWGGEPETVPVGAAPPLAPVSRGVEAGALLLQGGDLEWPHAGPVSLGLWDAAGRPLIRMRGEGAGILRVPSSRLPTGTYWMIAEDGKGAVRKKVVAL